MSINIKIFSGLLDFLFGKDPDIFDENGNVVHKLPKKKWEAWQNRQRMEPGYNWRNHTGTQAGKRGNQSTDRRS